ncbi:hypothetical protein BGZ97_001613 [Linnemannia gamsii]|uniref:Uncharacterized protein n=1 Tax=Linnemannia gamsii TaxID=64522 RepID=A0A9P6QW42_9FUNG|nr:hypothetical protein BGZ97_001613 [Linnemannia gamsii]
MSYQQGPPPHPPPPPPPPPTNIQPNPPVLSFRAFHATHFSWPQRQAFFGGGAPENYYYHHHPWIDSHSSPISPIATDTLANASEPTWDHFQDLARHHHPQQQHTANKDKEITAIADEDDAPGTSMFGLTQEAIEIFEFSRRFREEKRAALAEERARMARRRTKRRRLTRRGFAPDEGNSGSDDETADLSDAADKNKNNNFNKKKGDPDDDDSDNGSSSGSGSEDEGRGGGGSEEEEDDEFVVQTEPPATDVAFLTQPSRQRDRTRQKLYGLKKASDTIKDKETTSSTTSDEMWSMRMLEAMLNQTFIESLGGPETTATATTAGQSNRRRSRDSSGKGGRRSQQQSQIVYWPGMPMRC